jgi:hypothetical protein
VRGEAHGLARGPAGLPLARTRRGQVRPARPATRRGASGPGPGGRSSPGADRDAARPGPRGGGKAGLFAELGTSWLLLDAELLPWNVKAGPLLRDQYAAVGRGRPASLPAAVSVLEQASARGSGPTWRPTPC